MEPLVESEADGGGLGGVEEAKFEFSLWSFAATAAAAARASEGFGGVVVSCSFPLPWSSHFLLRLKNI